MESPAPGSSVCGRLRRTEACRCIREDGDGEREMVKRNEYMSTRMEVLLCLTDIVLYCTYILCFASFGLHTLHRH